MHIPFEKLPPDIQEKVLGYLQTDNFIAAKNLRDEYEQHLQNSMRQKSAKDINTKAAQDQANEKRVFTDNLN